MPGVNEDNEKCHGSIERFKFSAMQKEIQTLKTELEDCQVKNFL